MIHRTAANLQAYNTMAVPCRADHFRRITDRRDLQELVQRAADEHEPVHVLGGGSNVLLPVHIEGLVIQPAILGKQILSQTDSHARIRVGAGENWHRFVEWALQHQFHGLENLALIPGSVGAAPVQNIGAYGVELVQFVENVEVLDRQTGTVETLSRAECAFCYRDSVFKHRLKDRCIITHVVFRLPRVSRPDTSYPALQEALPRGGRYSSLDVFHAVCRIRRERLPDPETVPNCGSFFKNPVVSTEVYQALLRQYPNLVAYQTGAGPEQGWKLAAGWLIDQAGWKGTSRYGITVHERQALVLVNPHRKPALDVLALAGDIQSDIQARFGITLEREPELLGWS